MPVDGVSCSPAVASAPRRPDGRVGGFAVLAALPTEAPPLPSDAGLGSHRGAARPAAAAGEQGQRRRARRATRAFFCTKRGRQKGRLRDRGAARFEKKKRKEEYPRRDSNSESSAP
eukprot:scaffold26609_cov59-Phaeocystis_antarctica.AAC.6